jgi:hypothetical protein
MPWPDDGIQAVLYNIRSIRTVPHELSDWLKWAPSTENILSAVILNPTCNNKIKCHRLRMASGLCCITFEVFIVPHGLSGCAEWAPRAQKTY